MSLPPAPPPIESRQSTRDLLLRSWPGRLFLGSLALKILVAIWRGAAGELNAAGQTLSAVATIGLLIALGYFVWRLFVLIKRRLLWRVRRKLILSYIFMGVIPSVLILVFFLFAGSMVFMTVSAYLFKSGYDKVLDDARVASIAAASEIDRIPDAAQQTIERVYRIRGKDYPGLSLAYLAADGTMWSIGRWDHSPPPGEWPAWLKDETFTGAITIPGPQPGAVELVVRSATKVGTNPTHGIVVVDIPIDDHVAQSLQQRTSVQLGDVTVEADPRTVQQAGNSASFFGRSMAQLEYVDWDTGRLSRATVLLTYKFRELYKQLSNAQGFFVRGMRLGDAVLLFVFVVACLFLIIEGVALIMGLALARSITSSVHELFMGTERVRQGDFTHRIRIRSRDQLGELADSFNQMTGSIENLLQTAAEKKRLEEELRIARQIQMSLLPRGPLDVPGLAITALCVPAREVGGDYYDFFPLGNRRMGLLIADVSGKGTSAALYMAELKGLVLSLSQIYQSPRQLLIEVNRIISENLDSRSFITMTYAVVDLGAGLMTYARAGHTPMIYLPASSSAAAESRVLAPSGMVLGLRIPGAAEKFEELLEEDRLPLRSGDVVVLYTDGITEAMNAASDLFGESRLSRIVEEHGHLDSAELRERILREIEAFVGSADQHDDMTMILLKVEPAAVLQQEVAV